MVKKTFIEAKVTKTYQGIELDLPPITYEELPHVSVLTITYNRKHFFQLMWNNWKNYKYPTEKLEWVIIDDSPGTDHDLTDILPQYPNIRYIKVSQHMSVGAKRNFGVEHCDGEIIVHQDDDDYYFPDSILAKVRILKQYPKAQVVFSNNLAAYNIMNNISYMMDPKDETDCLSLPEASLLYRKKFWEQQKFPEDHFGEGKGFVFGRQKKCVSIPCIFNMVSFTHSRNMTGLARNVEKDSIDHADKISNYFDLFDGITKNIVRKLSRQISKELSVTNYDRIFIKNFVGHDQEDDTTKVLGSELEMLSHLPNHYLINHIGEIQTIDPPLSDNDLLLVAWYSTHDIRYIVHAVDKPKEKLPKDAKILLQHPRSKLMVYNSWECRDYLDPYTKGSFCQYVTKHLNIPLDRVIVATTDFLNPLVHSLSPQIIGYDFPYLLAKQQINSSDTLQVSSNAVTKNNTIIMLNRRGSLERTALALFLYTNFSKCVDISYLTKDKYPEQDIRKFGVTTQKYNEFCSNLPMILSSGTDNQTHEIDKVATKEYGNEIALVDWERQDDIFDNINKSFIMLTMETNVLNYKTHVQQVSEKTYKAIKLGMPFILFTSKPGILKHLKSLGFKTFSPYICEEYDLQITQEKDPYNSEIEREYYQRLRKLMKELNRLCRLSQDKLVELWNNCLPIVNHNLTILKNMDNIKQLPIIEK